MKEEFPSKPEGNAPSTKDKKESATDTAIGDENNNVEDATKIGKETIIEHFIKQPTLPSVNELFDESVPTDPEIDNVATVAEIVRSASTQNTHRTVDNFMNSQRENIFSSTLRPQDTLNIYLELLGEKIVSTTQIPQGTFLLEGNITSSIHGPEDTKDLKLVDNISTTQNSQGSEDISMNLSQEKITSNTQHAQHILNNSMKMLQESVTRSTQNPQETLDIYLKLLEEKISSSTQRPQGKLDNSLKLLQENIVISTQSSQGFVDILLKVEGNIPSSTQNPEDTVYDFLNLLGENITSTTHSPSGIVDNSLKLLDEIIDSSTRSPQKIMHNSIFLSSENITINTQRPQTTAENSLKLLQAFLARMSAADEQKTKGSCDDDTDCKVSQLVKKLVSHHKKTTVTQESEKIATENFLLNDSEITEKIKEGTIVRPDDLIEHFIIKYA